MIVGRQCELAELDQLVCGAGVGVVLRGERGIGKTALADEFVVGLAGRAVVSRVVATSASQVIPFGALAALLPQLPSESISDVQLLTIALAAVRARAGEGRLVVSVDDVGLLDRASATVIDHLVRSGDVVLVATQPSELPLPPWLVGLVQLDLVRPYELGPLDRSALEELVSAQIGRAFDVSAVDELWRLSEGNPLIAREMLTAASMPGTLVEQSGAWHARRPFPVTERLGELLDARLAGCSAAEMAVLEMAAVAGVVGLAALESVGCTLAVEALETAHLLDVFAEENRVLARVGHPMLSDRIVASMPLTRRRRICRSLASWTSATGARRRGDTLRVPTWQLDGGTEVQPDVAVHAAKQALAGLDAELAKRLCEAALGAGAGFEAQLTLAQAMLSLGEVEQADEVLQRARHGASDDRDIARAAAAQCEVLVLGRRDLAAAIDVAGAAVGTIGDADWLDEVHTTLARLALEAGKSDEALRIGAEIAVRPNASPCVATVGLMVSASAQVMLGSFGKAESDARRGLANIDRGADPPPTTRDRIMFALIESLLYAGRFDEAARAAEAAHRDAEGADVRAALGIWQAARGFVASWTGDIAASRTLYEQSIATLTLHDPFGLLSRVRARAALATAQAGDLASVREHLADVDYGYVVSRVRTEVAGMRARAWCLALDGDTEAAARGTLKAALTAVDYGHNTMAAVALHDAVRFGHPHVVVEELHGLLPPFDGLLLPIFARHATAAVDGDGVALDAVAADLSSIGANLLAAEAASQAAVAHRRTARERDAFRSQNRVNALVVRCPGARTPALAQQQRALTAREEQVARLAAHHASREVATRLMISVRTVETHLAAVFHKLDIHNRADLAAIFDLDT